MNVILPVKRFGIIGLLSGGLLVTGAATAGVSANGSATEVMLVNGQTGKCLTIAGGVSTDNNVESLQFDCDNHPSRRWALTAEGGEIYQIRNVQTGKCLTIAGGVSTDN